jgi:RNA polymerase sigma-32 factor
MKPKRFTMLDLLFDERVTQEDQTATAQRDASVREAVATVKRDLDERERAILDLRLMTDDEEVTLADIGKQFGLSRERVRQLEARAKSKLRRALGPVAAAA